MLIDVDLNLALMFNIALHFKENTAVSHKPRLLIKTLFLRFFGIFLSATLDLECKEDRRDSSFNFIYGNLSTNPQALE